MKKLSEMFIALLMSISFFLPISAFAEDVVFATSEWEPYVISENGKPSGDSDGRGRSMTCPVREAVLSGFL